MNKQREKLKIGIVEDDMIIAGAITEMLLEIGYEVPDNATRYSEAIQLMESEQPDLMLLDINLVGQMDGIDVAETIRKKFDIPFIFLTANMDASTVQRAKSVRPSSYLAKPVTKDQLYSAIEVAFFNYNSNRPEENRTESADNELRDWVFIKDGHSFRKVYYKELQYLESESNYVALHLTSGRKILVRSGLDEFISQLDAHQFMRVHRGYAVNISLIDGLDATEVSVAGIKIPVGRTYRDDIRQKLGIADS